jgi:hypothetical protein
MCRTFAEAITPRPAAEFRRCDFYRMLSTFSKPPPSGGSRPLLGMEREKFIRYASEQGIPHFQLEGADLQRELDAIKKL